jgi:hypothetical protein
MQLRGKLIVAAPREIAENAQQQEIAVEGLVAKKKPGMAPK